MSDEKITAGGKRKALMLLFTLVYFTSYVTRINYAAIISEIIRSEGILKSTASLALTGSSVAYGIGQILSGYLGDKIQPKTMISAGLLTTIMMNLAVPFLGNPYLTAAVWTVNGLAQAFMWPPLVKIMTHVFTEDDYKKAVVLVSWGSSFGTVAVYLTAPLLITLSGWRAVFVLSALAALVMLIFWLMKCPKITLALKSQPESKKGGAAPFSFMLFGIIAAIVLQGFLRDGVSTWMPSLISETFNLGTNISILTGVGFPLFSVVAFYAVSRIYRARVRNELSLAGIIFFLGAFSALMLSVLRDKNAILTVTLVSLLIGSMHGVNLMLIGMVPRHYEKFGRISLMSGLFNSFTYLGSAASAYGMAAYTERFGWNSMIVFWAVVALTGGIICLSIKKPWLKFTGS